MQGFVAWNRYGDYGRFYRACCAVRPNSRAADAIVLPTAVMQMWSKIDAALRNPNRGWCVFGFCGGIGHESCQS